MSTSTAFFGFNKYPLIAVCLAFILTACGGGDNTLTLTGTVLDSYGAPVPNAMVTVHSDPVVVHTDNYGHFSCKIPHGKHHIRAEKHGRVFLDRDFTTSDNGDQHDLGEIKTNYDANATLSNIAITPSNATVAIGQAAAFSATGTYSDATTADLTNQATWSSANTAIATINTSTGIATGVAQGSTSVSALFGGISAPAAALTVGQPPLGPVLALFSNNGNWNDYVAGNDWKTATDTACNFTDTACLHGGELRVVVATGQTSCNGLTAADDFGAFKWECDASTNPVRLVSTGLADGKNMSDLIDFVNPGFKANKVTVYSNGISWNSTPSTTWWSNPVAINNGGGDLITPSAIYLVTSNPAAAITFWADKIALVIQPGVTITGPNSGLNVITTQNYAHLWLEGNIDASAYSYGVALDARFSMLRNLAVNNGGSGGLILTSAVNNTLMGVSANNNTGTGITFNNGVNNTLRDVMASNNSVNGVSLGGTNNIVKTMRANNNGGIGVNLNLASNNYLSDVTASNNGTGVNLLSSSNNTLADVTASNNGTGVNLANSSNNIITSMTASNNSGMGITLFPASNNTLVGVTASNNNLGVYLRTASYNTLADVTASNNTTGVYLYSSSNNSFTGLLKVGNNSSSNCTVAGTATNPGLVTGTCAANGSSTAVNDNTITLANSFVGKVTSDDAANASDTAGTAGFPITATFDWVHFDNKYRSWGIDGSIFPNMDQRGRWIAGAGRIWDWSLLASDVVNRGILTLPTGDNTMTHTWSDATSTTFLRNAVEITADGIGNDNGLCESGETCRFTPNIGSYQGSGNLVSAGTFTGGLLTGITLMQYATNGEAAQP